MQTGYHPRQFDQSPLFQIVYEHFDSFQVDYNRLYVEQYGYHRGIITHTVERYLECGDPREGVARYESGSYDYRCGSPDGDKDIAYPQFQPVKRWDGAVITEIFRWRLLKSLVKKKVISPEIADNMLSWPHSGFNVHATAPFSPDDAELVENRLAYAFRPPVALNRLDYNGTTVTLTTTKRVELKLTPLDFLAKITLHIADRYQNIRRYAGYYSPNIQSKVRRARPGTDSKHQAEEKIPIIENPPLAWSLVDLDIGDEIPEELYKTVAEVLVQVYRLKEQNQPKPLAQ